MNVRYSYSTGSRTIQEAVNEGLLIEVTETAKKVCELVSGDHIIITGGHVSGVSGNTSLIKVEKV